MNSFPTYQSRCNFVLNIISNVIKITHIDEGYMGNFANKQTYLYGFPIFICFLEVMCQS